MPASHTSSTCIDIAYPTSPKRHSGRANAYKEVEAGRGGRSENGGPTAPRTLLGLLGLCKLHVEEATHEVLAVQAHGRSCLISTGKVDVCVAQAPPRVLKPAPAHRHALAGHATPPLWGKSKATTGDPIHTTVTTERASLTCANTKGQDSQHRLPGPLLASQERHALGEPKGRDGATGLKHGPKVVLGCFVGNALHIHTQTATALDGRPCRCRR